MQSVKRTTLLATLSLRCACTSHARTLIPSRSLHTTVPCHIRLTASTAMSGHQQPDHDPAQSVDLGPALSAPREGWAVVRAAVYQPEHADSPAVPVFTAMQELFPDLYASNTGAKRACRRKEVCVDGLQANTSTTVRAGGWVQLVGRDGQTLRYKTPRPPRGAPPPPQLKVLLEDDQLAVVYKPSGLPFGAGYDSLMGAIKYCLLPSRAHDALNNPRPAHRLDAATCGVVVCAKTRTAMVALSQAFKDRTIKKRYLAILKGSLEQGAQGVIDAPISGKPSITEYQVLQETPSKTFGTLCTISLKPLTGRTHQLRRHCAEHLYLGMLGDPKYRAVHRPTKADTGSSQPWAAPDVNGTGTGAGTGTTETQPGHSEPEQNMASSETGTPMVHLTEQRPAVSGSQHQGTRVSEREVLNPVQDCVGMASEEDEGMDVCDEEECAEDEDGETGVGEGHEEGGVQHPGVARVGRRQDLLADGRRALLCLCAAELRFRHPVRGEEVVVSVEEPEFFEEYRRVEATGARAPV